MTPPVSLQDLLDIEAIKQLKADYFYLMDTKRWDEWRDLFTEDFRVEGPAAHEGGRDAFVDFVREHLQDVMSCHHGSMPLIEILDARTARGRWAMVDDLRLPAGHPWSKTRSRRHGYGYYDEGYRRDHDRWRMSSMRLSRLWTWSEPDDDPAARR
jgi:SnoaL-like domain